MLYWRTRIILREIVPCKSLFNICQGRFKERKHVALGFEVSHLVKWLLVSHQSLLPWGFVKARCDKTFLEHNVRKLCPTMQPRLAKRAGGGHVFNSYQI